jgi:hypothetical protein
LRFSLIVAHYSGPLAMTYIIAPPFHSAPSPRLCLTESLDKEVLKQSFLFIKKKGTQNRKKEASTLSGLSNDSHKHACISVGVRVYRSFYA